MTIQTPAIPVVNNIDVAVETDPARASATPCAPGRRPGALGGVRAGAARARRAQAIVECGPRRAGAGWLTKRIAPELQAAALYDPATLAEVRALLAG